MTDENDPQICGGDGECHWTLTGGGQVACQPGGEDCMSAKLLTTTPSVFHDQTLIDLTEQINALLQAVPPDSAGRKLSFMYTRMGPLLGWVQHGQENSGTASGVTADADNETLIQALGLLV